MATTSRRRHLSADPAAVWRVVADPHHLPRWWPGVIRVEGVDATRFTEVVPTKRGKPVRLDFRVSESTPHERRTWTQLLPGSPFERLLDEWRTTVILVADDGGTLVTIEEVQQLRGSFRLGWLLQRRPARRRLDQALRRLAELVG